jgi:transcriptional regulator of arginine metabolism
MSKSYRQGQILKLVRSKQINTQDELANELKSLGIAATQVTLSRDIRDPGHANSVAVALDNEEWPEVVGTIAGDDTILVIAPDSATANSVCAKLLAILKPV